MIRRPGPPPRSRSRTGRTRPIKAAAALLALVAAVALALAGCGGGDELTVEDAWMRPTPPGADTTAVYATIIGGGEQGDRLVSVSATPCEQAEVHATVTDDGVAMMRPADPRALVVAEDANLYLEPNGLHVMCLGVTEPLAEGTTVAVTFAFDSGRSITVDVPVRQFP